MSLKKCIPTYILFIICSSLFPFSSVLLYPHTVRCLYRELKPKLKASNVQIP